MSCSFLEVEKCKAGGFLQYIYLKTAVSYCLLILFSGPIPMTERFTILTLWISHTQALSFLLALSFTEFTSGFCDRRGRWWWSGADLSWSGVPILQLYFRPHAGQWEALSVLTGSGFAGDGVLKKDWCFLILLASSKYVHFKCQKIPPFFNKHFFFGRSQRIWQLLFSKALIISSFTASDSSAQKEHGFAPSTYLDVLYLISNGPPEGSFLCSHYWRLHFLVSKHMSILLSCHQTSLLQLQWALSLSPKRQKEMV